MFISIKLDDNTDCKYICKSIQEKLFNKLLKDKISLKNKQLYVTIKEPIEYTEPISPKSNQKMLF